MYIMLVRFVLAFYVDLCVSLFVVGHVAAAVVLSRHSFEPLSRRLMA